MVIRQLQDRASESAANHEDAETMPANGLERVQRLKSSLAIRL
jgi:hypothetical protein